MASSAPADVRDMQAEKEVSRSEEDEAASGNEVRLRLKALLRMEMLQVQWMLQLAMRMVLLMVALVLDLNALKVQRALLKRQLKVYSKTLKAQAWAPGFMSLETHIKTFLRF